MLCCRHGLSTAWNQSRSTSGLRTCARLVVSLLLLRLFIASLSFVIIDSNDTSIHRVKQFNVRCLNLWMSAVLLQLFTDSLVGPLFSHVYSSRLIV